MRALPLRLAPLLAAAAIPLLGLKLVGIAAELAGQAVAPAAAAAAAPQTPAVPAAPPAHAAAPASSPASSPASAPLAASAAGGPAASPAKPASKSETGGDVGDPTSFSPAEINLLQELAQRRGELDKRADELDGRDMMLKAAEERIAEKIAALQKMQDDIGALLHKKDEENDQKIKSIVRIYETMKPPEAARIFEQLDMPVLLEVVEHMSERKAAPILASMPPLKAKALTLALAERKQAPKP
jgi:flagellar motility protein MotE (MotC chaperone)